ncbi:hypothetical protein M9Y10_000405 [Tritrichomonas musculus]|uniref:Protein kinase domain-containing protein n=1 Tax=Tritrichomonas musculus TaxID=1915356 RepID=A0ABR2L454_9EUKA
MPRQKYHLPKTISFKQMDGTENVFIRNEELGRGSFSIVYRVIHQNTNKTYAMKVISKKEYMKSRIAFEDLQNEIKIQRLVNHPNVVTSDFSFSDEHNHYFILEYCPGRTVREYLHKSDNSRLREPEARKILRDVVQGLVYIHNHDITHYDLKLENFVIDSNGNVRIGDFGLSTFCRDEKGKKFSIFGTLNYLSPEMVSRGNREETAKVDVWTVGVAAFILLTGREPFEGKTKEITFQNIRKGEFQFPICLSLSNEAKDFVSKILQIDPRKRPTAKELLGHPFLTKIDSEAVCLYKSSNLPPLTKSPTTKPVCGPPKEDKKPIPPRPQNANLKPVCSPPKEGKKHVTPRRPKVNLKPICSPVIDDDAQEEDDKKESADVSMKAAINHPKEDDKKESADVNVEAAVCPPKEDDKKEFEGVPKVNLKAVICPPSDDDKEESPRIPNVNLKAVIRPPSKDVRPVTPKQPGRNIVRPITPRKSNAKLKPACCSPRNGIRPISPRVGLLNSHNKVTLTACNDIKPITVKNFDIPNHFVSRHCFYNDDLGYLLFDGTVGICFKDKSRVVMDPNEQFIQFYEKPSTFYPEVTRLDNLKGEEAEPRHVSLVKKVARHFKKIRFSYDLPDVQYESVALLHNISCFVKNDDSILFKLDDKNLQVNFSDHMKLIIFWNTKKMCFFRSVKEKCSLLDLKYVASMNSNSDELKKFKNAKILLSDLALTIC